jgi:hypothetical protein
MAWLDNIRVTAGKDTFTSIVERVQPVLSQCAVTTEAGRAADCLAHMGWGDFLRSREGAGGLDPVQHYRRALEVDPENVYAHAMWAFDILRSGGAMGEAKAHFTRALASGREGVHAAPPDRRPALARRPRDGGGAHPGGERHPRERETMPGGRSTRSDTWRLWNVYYSACCTAGTWSSSCRPCPPRITCHLSLAVSRRRFP